MTSFDTRKPSGSVSLAFVGRAPAPASSCSQQEDKRRGGEDRYEYQRCNYASFALRYPAQNVAAIGCFYSGIYTHRGLDRDKCGRELAQRLLHCVRNHNAWRCEQKQRVAVILSRHPTAAAAKQAAVAAVPGQKQHGRSEHTVLRPEGQEVDPICEPQTLRAAHTNGGFSSCSAGSLPRHGGRQQP